MTLLVDCEPAEEADTSEKDATDDDVETEAAVEENVVELMMTRLV